MEIGSALLLTFWVKWPRKQERSRDMLGPEDLPQPECHQPWKAPGPTPHHPFSPEPPPGASLEAAALALPPNLASTSMGLLGQQLKRRRERQVQK